MKSAPVRWNGYTRSPVVKHFITHPDARDTVDVSMSKARVQECRLFAALLESGWSLVTNSEQATAIRNIQPYFPVSISSDIPSETRTISIHIDHPAPQTSFGEVTKKLIFPTWLGEIGAGVQRDIPLSYSGFPTRERVAKLVAMHQVVLPQAANISEISALSALRFGLQSFYFRKTNYQWSKKGRDISGKIFDPDYWEILHRSHAVYCPAGDFGWTYRFYESMLAGALPVLDAPAEFGQGYHYHPSNKPLPDEIDPAILAENRSHALAEITAREALAP